MHSWLVQKLRVSLVLKMKNEWRNERLEKSIIIKALTNSCNIHNNCAF